MRPPALRRMNRADLTSAPPSAIGRRKPPTFPAKSPKPRSRTPTATKWQQPTGAAICSRNAAGSWRRGEAIAPRRRRPAPAKRVDRRYFVALRFDAPLVLARQQLLDRIARDWGRDRTIRHEIGHVIEGLCGQFVTAMMAQQPSPSGGVISHITVMGVRSRKNTSEKKKTIPTRSNVHAPNTTSA